MCLINSPAGRVFIAAVLGCAFFRWDCLEYDTFADWGGPRDSITIHAGNSVAHNIAVQTIDPWPPHASNSRIDIDGQRLMNGMARYKANMSLPPRGMSTQSITNGVSSNGN